MTRLLSLLQIEEMGDKIFRYCELVDTKNLALTNSKYNEAIQPFIQHTIRLRHHHFPRLPFLTHTVVLNVVSLFDTPVSAVRDMGTLKWLRHLHIGLLNDTILAAICRDVRQLFVLRIYNSKITSKGCWFLPLLQDLTVLHLDRCTRIGANGFLYISELSKLQELRIEACMIEDAAVCHVSTLLNLKRLILHYEKQITNKGFAEIVKLTNLEILDLHSCSIKKDDISMLYDSLRNLKVLKLF